MIPCLALLDADLAYVAGSDALSSLDRLVLAVEGGQLRPVKRHRNVCDDLGADMLAVAFTEQTYRTLASTPLEAAGIGGDAGGARYLDVLRLDPATDLQSPLLKALCQRSAVVIEQLVEQNVELTMSTAAIRREVETLQNNLVEAEKAIRAFGPGERIAYTVFPTEESVPIPGSVDAAARQLLPVGSYGVSSVDLFFCVPAMRTMLLGGDLMVSLRLLETREVVGAWRADISTLETGWRSFKVKRAIEVENGHLELSIYSTDPNSGVLLALGVAHPSQKATLSGVDGPKRPLALRVGQFVPGLTVKDGLQGNAASPANDGPLIRRISVAQFERCEVEGMSADEARTGMVHYYHDDSQFQVHPKAGTVVKAILRNALPTGTIRIVSQVQTRHEKAKVVQFGLMAIPSRRSRSRVSDALTMLNGPASQFSGWVDCQPMRRRQVELHFEMPLNGAHDLILLTRSTGSTDYAWARFFDVWYEVQHPDIVHVG